MIVNPVATVRTRGRGPAGGRTWIHRLVASGTVLISMTAALTAAPQASATYPGANGRIAFTANLNGKSWQLFTMEPNGTDLRQLTHIPGSADVSLAPDWSPDGTQIVFHSSKSGR